MKAFHLPGFVALVALSVRGQATLYGQCGGIGWAGPTTCVSDAVCTYQNPHYSQCLPRGGGTKAATCPTTTTTATGASVRSTSVIRTRTRTTSSHSATSTGKCGTPPASAGKLRYAGVNIPGFDFGVDTNGDASPSGAQPPLGQHGAADGIGQMTHFVNDDKYNIFRLPVGWQYLTNNQGSGHLDQTYFSEYDTLVEGCLKTGAKCIIDIHNYARWNGAIIGQGGPTNEDFASLWRSLASHYSSKSNVVFAIMNEPHDLPSIALWAETVQTAVTAIRQAGATKQTILLPGNHWTSAKTFVSGGSAAALAAVTNPDGSHNNLIFDVHMYLDWNDSGTSDACVTNHIEDAWKPLAGWLRCNGRQALLTETGGGNTASCVEYMCQQIRYLAKNSDVILGYVGWGAGSLETSYTLSETPAKNGATWSDQLLVSSCLAPSANGLVASG